MTSILALVVLLAGSPPAGKAPAPVGAELEASPLDGCEAERLEDGWSYHCGPQLNVLQRDFPGRVLDPGPVALGFAMDSAAKLGGTKRKPERLRLGADDVSLVRVEGGWGPMQHRYFAAVARPGGVRTIICGTSRAPKTCARILEVLHPQPWPQPSAGGPVRGAREIEASAITFGGRSLRIPDGCSGGRRVDPGAWGGDIRCEHGQVLWRSHWSDTSARKNLARMVKDRVGQAKATTRAVACRIAGVKTTCQRTRADTKDGATTWVTGVAPDGMAPSAVLCWVDGKDASAAPCSVLFELR
jgi:hypothetical protein